MQAKQVTDIAKFRERSLTEKATAVLAGTIVDGSAVADVKTELTLLASILLHYGISDVIDVLPSKDAFYSETYRRAYGAMQSLHAEGERIDIGLVHSRLVSSGALASATANELCNEIVAHLKGHSVLPQTQPRALALNLRAVHTRRKLAILAIELQARAHHMGEDMPLEALLELASTQLEAIAEASGGGSRNINAKSGLVALVRSWKEAKGPMLTLGIPTIDRCMGGMAARKTTVLAARTSVGKSIAAQSIALECARKGDGVFYVSLEMDSQQLLGRMVACIGAVNSRVALNRMPGDAVEQRKVHDAMVELAGLPIEIWPSQSANMAEICRGAADSQKSLARDGKRLGLVVIDHVHLVRHAGDARLPRHEQIAAISRQARLLADRLNVHVLMLAQCSRESEKQRGKSNESTAPQLHHIAESDKLAQDADNVLLLHAPRDANGQWVDRPGSLILAKCRDGEIGACDVKIVREWQRIREVNTSGFTVGPEGF